MRSGSRRWPSALGAVLVVLTGCSSDGSSVDVAAGGACEEVEQLVEPGGAPHVLQPDGGSHRFHPPASGAHFAGNPPEPGVHSEPVPEALQVTALEVGAVVISYDRRIDDTSRASLEALADERDDVLVTPAAAPIDQAAEVAFTAWERRQLCDEVSIGAAEEFIDAFAGRGPGEVVDEPDASQMP